MEESKSRKKFAMHQIPGIGERLKKSLKELGYTRKGRIDLARFALEHQYHVVYLHKWVKGVNPSYHYLKRLALDLGVSPAWLLLGDDGMQVPKRPASSTSALPTATRSAERPESADYVKRPLARILPAGVRLRAHSA